MHIIFDNFKNTKICIDRILSLPKRSIFPIKVFSQKSTTSLLRRSESSLQVLNKSLTSV